MRLGEKASYKGTPNMGYVLCLPTWHICIFAFEWNKMYQKIITTKLHENNHKINLGKIN